MMLNKTEGRPAIPRDGRHCDLCGCSQPAVRCDKCGRQVFCLSCDDMYHRHPKRRFHLRKAVDATPPSRPALPAKGGTLGGDPSKMPLPPPRKKKAFFDTFRKRSPSGEQQQSSPPLPKKEYAWTFGNIKKFMSNRPLPPLPDTKEEAPTATNKHDLSFIHKKVDEKPPQLPQRSLKPNEFNRGPHEKENHPNSTNGVRDVRNGTLNPAHMSRNNGYGAENQWTNHATEQPNPNTLMRQPGYMYPGNPGYPGTMSASTTDLPTMEVPHPQYPYPPMPYPHYPPPMYPHPQYPGYFGSSFGNLSSQPATTTDGDHSDHSDVSASRSGNKKYQFRKRAKRSQSVLMDRMAYPGQFYPFGPFPPGYGPWGGGPFPPSDPPPRSPSLRSLSRGGGGRTRRRQKTTSEDEDASSSPLSRPKSSSSSGRPQQKMQQVVTSSSEEEYEEAQRGRSERVPRRDSDPKKLPSPVPRSPQMQQKFFYKQRKGERIGSSDAEDTQKNVAKFDRSTPPSSSTAKETNEDPSTESSSTTPFTPLSQWECSHCTYINPAGNRICQVCCKTATVDPPPADGRNSAQLLDGRSSSQMTDGRNSAGQLTADGGRTQSACSEQSCSSPEKRIDEEEDVDTRRNKQDMAVLNSALDEAEKEISRGLEELMKLKQDFPPARPTPPPQNKPEAKPPQTPPPQQSKPVYKSSGKLRNASILDKITMPPTKTTSTSTCTETQTSTDHVIEARRGQTSNSDHVAEARRGSTSSTTSDAYNSPMAQSPILQRTSPQGAVKKGPKRDTSIQTDDLTDYRTKAEDEAYFERTNNGYGFRYGDGMTSPVPYDRGGYHHPVMQRSHSRASLFTGRMNDLGPLDYGLGPSPMYRSVSRGSLTGDYPENSFADFHNLRKPAYYLSMEELVERRRQDSIRAQGLELVRMIREAEQQGFTADDIQVALHNCAPNQTPVEWLQDNWRQLAAQVVALSANYANDKRDNDVGVVSDVEAREALRLHKGNVWPAVTECVESRQRKFLELKARGKFSTKDITDALSTNQGDVELAYAKLTKSSSKPFLMRIWGAGEGAQNQDGAIPPKAAPTNAKDLQEFYYKDRDDIQSTGTWDEDDVEWDEDYDEEEEEEEEQGDLEDLQTCHEDLTIKTPDSDRSDYCDAFGSNTLERNVSLPAAEPETKLVRRGSFLSKLAGLKRNDKDSRRSSQIDLSSLDASKDNVSQENLVPSPDQSKSYNPISVIKNTISAIRDTVGGSKSEKKLPCAAPERRTIVVKSQIPPESPSIASGGDGGVTLTSVKPLQDSEPPLTASPREFSENKLKDCTDFPIKTPKNVNVNQQGTTPEDARNKNSESVSSKSTTKPSFEIGVSEVNSSRNKLDSKLQEMPATKENSISQEKKSNVINDDNISSSESKELSSQSNKTSKFSFKNQLKNSEKDLQSEQKTQEIVKDTKNNVKTEIKPNLSPENSSSFHKEFRLKTNKEEQKGKTKSNLEKQSLVNKLTSDDVSNTSPNSLPSDGVSNTSRSFSSKIPEKEHEIHSVNEAKRSKELPYLNDQNITNETRSEQKPKSDSSETHINASKEIISDIKSGDSKGIRSDIRTVSPLKNTSTTNASSSIHPSSPIVSESKNLDGNSNIPKTSETSSLGNEESQIIKDLRDLSNNPVQNASKCNNDKLVQGGDEAQIICDVDASLSDPPSHETARENESPTFESMEPIHSSTFKRSISNQSVEGKLVSQVSSETLSMETIESQTSSTNIPDNEATIIETNQALTTEEVSVDAKIPVQVFEMSSSTVNDSKKQGVKLVENEMSKEIKEVPSTLSSSKVKNSALFKEADKSLLVSSSSSNAAPEIMKENSLSLESNTVSSLKIGSQLDVESDSINQTNFEQNEELHSKSSLQKTNTIMPSSPTSDTISVNKEETFDKSAALEYRIPESDIEAPALVSSAFADYVHSSPVPVTSFTDTSLSTASTVFASSSNASPAPTVSAASVSNDTAASSSTVSLSTVSTTVLYGSGITPITSLSDASVLTDYITSTSLPNAVPSVSASPVASDTDASVPAASISTDLIHTTSLSTASTTVASASTTVASASTSISPASTSVSSVSTSVSPASTNVISDSTFVSSSSSTTIISTSTTVTSAVSSSTITSASSITYVTASAPTDSLTTAFNSTRLASSTDASATTDSSTTSSISTSATRLTSSIDTSPTATSPSTSVPNASVPTDSIPTSSPPTAGDVSTLSVSTQETSTDNEGSDEDFSEPLDPPSPIDALRHRFEGLMEEGSVVGPIRPASPFRRMSFRSRKEAIALERTRDTSVEKPWFLPKPKAIETKKPLPKRSLKQQMETERKVRQMVADRKVRTYRKAEIVVQLMDLNFEEEEAIQAASECSNFEMALSYLQQECLLCTGHFPVSHIISMVHCQHKACRDCIRAYFTVQIRDRNIMELLCPFCNEPDISDEDIAQDYFNHLDMMLKKLVDPEIHELFQRKLRDRVLMRDPSFRWCSKCSSGFLAMENMQRLVCPDCNAVTCASCRRPWEREHQGISCEAFAALKDGNDNEAQAVSLAKLLTEDGIDCPRCHFRYALAKGGCMHFRCIQCQHDFCSGCSRPFKMGQKCGVSEFCAKLGLHAHHPRNCLFYLRDKDPEDLQRLLDLSGVQYDRDPPASAAAEDEGGARSECCQVMEQKETADGMLDDCCGKDVEKGFAGLCRLHYVEYLGQLVNKHQVDPIQIFENDDLELVLRRANIRLPPKRYRETDESYREKLVNLINEELPLDKMDGS